MTEPAENKQTKISDHLLNLMELLRLNKADDAKRLLTRVDALLTARDEGGRGAAHYAAVGGCLPILQYVITMNEQTADEPDSLGWTPLMIASSAGRLDIVTFLLSIKASVNSKSSNGQTPLHYAASKNHKEISRRLIAAGADVNASDRYGATPLHRAASQGHDQIVHLLLAQPKIHVDARDSEGNTPLFVACEENREDAAIALAAKGAMLEIKNKDGNSPLSVVQTSDLRLKLKKAEQRANAMEQE